MTRSWKNNFSVELTYYTGWEITPFSRLKKKQFLTCLTWPQLLFKMELHSIQNHCNFFMSRSKCFIMRRPVICCICFIMNLYFGIMLLLSNDFSFNILFIVICYCNLLKSVWTIERMNKLIRIFPIGR